MTHIQSQRIHFNEIADIVCGLLGWNDLQYAAYIEKTGKQYLQEYISNDPVGIDHLVASRRFWNWWRTNWYQRDAQFAYQPGIEKLRQSTRFAIFQELHHPATLAACIYPNGKVLDASYPLMISEVIDNKTEVL